MSIKVKQSSQFSPRTTSASTVGALTSVSSPSPGCGNPLTKFNGQQQKQTEWCWAAVTAAIADFYGNTNFIVQCDVVNATLALPPGTDCCKTGGSSDCNKPKDINFPLKNTGNYDSAWPFTPPTFKEIQDQIDACHPLAYGFNWNNQPASPGHAITIIGYATNNGKQQVIVWDPDTGSNAGQHTVLYSDLWTNYLNNPVTFQMVVKTKKQ